MIYLCSDGFADQFGGPRGKKFRAGSLVRLFAELSQLPLAEQKEKLESRYNEWKDDLEQVDDVVIIGIKII